MSVGRRAGAGTGAGPSLRRVHLWVGLLGVGAFLASGLYMDVRYDHLRGMDAETRLVFRSTHIYLLLTSLLNLIAGLYVRTAPGWRGWLQGVGSILLVAAPVLCGVAFLREPWLSEVARPFSGPANYAAFGGTLAHALARLTDRSSLT